MTFLKAESVLRIDDLFKFIWIGSVFYQSKAYELNLM